jgi:hypothetical protein
VVFFVGLCGILAAWGGLIAETTDGNLYFFAVSGGREAGSGACVCVCVCVCVCLGVRACFVCCVGLRFAAP